VSKILASRAAFGEYTPQRYKGNHASIGSEEPIPNYFPAILTEAEFYAARTAIDPIGFRITPNGIAPSLIHLRRENRVR
jgi:hypothetical protein